MILLDRSTRSRLATVVKGGGPAWTPGRSVVSCSWHYERSGGRRARQPGADTQGALSHRRQSRQCEDAVAAATTKCPTVGVVQGPVLVMPEEAARRVFCCPAPACGPSGPDRLERRVERQDLRRSTD